MTKIVNCKIHGEIKAYHSGKNRYRCSECNKNAVSKRRKDIKIKAVNYKGGCCQRCNYNKCIDALEFHHKNPNEKDFSIGGQGYTRNWEKIKIELDKCDLLCSNCHREEHYKLNIGV